MSLARPMNVTFHRAFDMCQIAQGPGGADCVGCRSGVDVGQEASCIEGIELLAELQRQAKGRIIVMPGGGLTLRNIRKVAELAGVTRST
jgi:copper homeostasis protein